MPYQDLGVGNNTFDFSSVIPGNDQKDNSIGSQVSQIIATGKALREYTEAADAENKMNNPQESDQGVRLQESADPDQKIPVVYGKAFLGGKLVDVNMTADRQTMWYCLVLSEKTGTIMSNSIASVTSFEKIYYNGNLVTFESDGFTISKTTDKDGNDDGNLKGLVKIYCFNNGGSSPTGVGSGTVPSAAAHTLFPGWGGTHTLNELVFVLVKVSYNPEKNAAGLGDITVELNNTMTQGGDVLYDMMTNTRYGAGIPAADIKNA